jgi:hypothetical protein
LSDQRFPSIPLSSFAGVAPRSLGFWHGGLDAINCKPHYRSVMSYSRQFAEAPIPNRRLTDSWSPASVILLPNLTIDLDKTGTLNSHLTGGK